ncbi:Citrate transporter [Candidatus Methanoperedenaceae archaeon GB50]|nr:Citrate transporter [Candidatus Methanoperedenaceae archaeon GB50]
MKPQVIFIDFVLKEWLLIASGMGFALLSIYTKHLPVYSIDELQVLFILFVLFITVNGLQKGGLLLKIAQSIEKGKVIPLKLVLATFFLSMLVTNDIVLMVIVPLTLSLNINRKDILVILEALAANSGSALTPIGNPQNLYIYWFYGIHPCTFIKTIFPFSLVFLGLLTVSSLFVVIQKDLKEDQIQKINKKAYIYGVLFIVILLTVFHVLPLLTGVAVIFFALIFDRKALYVDYALLFSFFFFFGIADSLKSILASEITHSGHIFLLSALASQVMSNVPATLLVAKFTSNWQALLWGSNAGGFGSLFGSLANLIAYKLYITHEGANNTAMFTAKFLAIGYMALFISIGLYFLLYRPAALL